MNEQKIKQAQTLFFDRYPGGFANPEMVAIGKKHKMDKLTQLAQDLFNPEQFNNPKQMIENMIKMLTRSSMVSVFEKPKFRDYARGLSEYDQNILVQGLKEFLHGDEESGFNMMLDVLTMGKLAKWSVITVWGAYYKPQYHVFCKPTTVKNTIIQFDLKNLVYHPRPDYDFYQDYRSDINQMKKLVDPQFSVTNAHFSGFLMICMEMEQYL